MPNVLRGVSSDYHSNVLYISLNH